MFHYHLSKIIKNSNDNKYLMILKIKNFFEKKIPLYPPLGFELRI